jgi:ATP-binding cassette subfamily E protein 1
MLAGVEEPDSGRVDHSVAVSYKPQYLEARGNATVQSTLRSITSDIGTSLYATEMLRPLGLEHLLTKRVTQLSGGELQRLAIAACLSRDAQLYLLDEPAAYLDVEQRITAARTIRRTVERREAACLVVDHDILFLDYLSNRLLVFGGTPGVEGVAEGPLGMRDGMNLFLKDVEVTFRRDTDSHRPRANKAASLKDREQKAAGEYYYIG